MNFAIAETGGFVVCTNEGNADLGVSLPPLHIACLGIEKLIPRAADLGVFLRLLARSATGQPITAYSSHFHGPRPGAELHIVLVDNGRTRIRQSEEFRRSLNCIRCGACMNHVPGLSAQRRAQLSIDRARAHRFNPGANARRTEVSHASVGLQLVRFVHRCLPREDRYSPPTVGLAQSAGRAWTVALVEAAGDESHELTVPTSGALSVEWHAGPHNRAPAARFLLYNRFNSWGRQRDLPEFPPSSFRQQYRQREVQSKHLAAHPPRPDQQPPA